MFCTRRALPIHTFTGLMMHEAVFPCSSQALHNVGQALAARGLTSALTRSASAPSPSPGHMPTAGTPRIRASYRSSAPAGAPYRQRLAAAAQHDLVDARARHLDGLGQGVNADLHWLEELGAQDLARSVRRKPLAARHVAKVDPLLIQILTMNAHGFILNDNQRARRPMPRPPATQSRSGTGR